MKASIGTPQVDIYGIIDTASDLVWTQCVPCDICFNQIHPKFDPKNSSTYIWDQVHCSPQNSCNYVSGYASGLSKGVLAKEKVTITSTSGQELVLETHVPFNSSGKVSKGNICIDSGSPPLTLPPDFYSRLEVEVKKQISIDPIKNETLTGTWFAIELKLLMKMDQN
ncbi:aspartic proteinase cdr1 [Quercus suber]|uniref:Aspartic proteinase cdr1 n=1 Tax=Quercus suber TaxID=58331 RepID=A0AAW0IWB8_QUESU